MSPEVIVLLGKAIAAFIGGFIFGYYRSNPYKAVLYSSAIFIAGLVLSIEIADRQAKHIEQQQQVKTLK